MPGSNGSRAQARWVGARALASMVLVAPLMVGCGGSGSTPPKSPEILGIGADASHAVAGDAPIGVRVTLAHPGTHVFWQLEGPGQLVANEDGSANYVPPDSEFLDKGETATLTAFVKSDSKAVQIVVDPKAAAGHVWTTGRPVPADWGQVAYGGGAFLAVQSRGRALRSTDGVAWAPVSLPSSATTLNAVAWGGAGWVGTMDGGKVVTSPDGVTWTEHGVVGYSRQIVFGNGRYVMATYPPLDQNDSPILVSTDGITWAPGEDAPGLIVFGNGVFVGFRAGTEVTSTDGLAWTPVTAPPSGLDAVAFGNGRFVATGGYTSVDGVTWTAATRVSSFWPNLSFAGGMFFSVGLDGLYSSSDGTAWTVQPLEDSYRGPAYVAEHDGTFVVVTSSGSLKTSRDGSIWETVIDGSVGNLTAVDYDDSTYMARNYVTVSDEGWALRSTDAQHWTRALIGAHPYDFRARALTHRSEIYLAVGDVMGSGWSDGPGVAYLSVDGQHWVSRSMPAGTPALVGVATDGARYLAVDKQGGVYASQYGDNWTLVASLVGATPRAMIFGGGRFMIVGDDGLVATSSDGTNWNVLPAIHALQGGTDAPVMLRAVTFDGQRYLAVGEGSIAATSSNGVAWTASQIGNPYALNAVAVGGGVVVAMSDSYSIFTSSDGLQWRDRHQDSPAWPWAAVVYGDNRFVAVGANSEIITSSP